MSTLHQIPLHPSGRPATVSEQVVNEKIFGECNHRDWTEITDRFGQNLLVCSQCGGEFPYDDDRAVPELSKSDFLLTAIRKYSEESVLANLIIRQVEAVGWQCIVIADTDQYTCTFERDAMKFKSGCYPSRPAAVCAAASKLAASGKFATKARG